MSIISETDLRDISISLTTHSHISFPKYKKDSITLIMSLSPANSIPVSFRTVAKAMITFADHILV